MVFVVFDSSADNYNKVTEGTMLAPLKSIATLGGTSEKNWNEVTEGTKSSNINISGGSYINGVKQTNSFITNSYRDADGKLHSVRKYGSEVRSADKLQEEDKKYEN